MPRSGRQVGFDADRHPAHLHDGPGRGFSHPMQLAVGYSVLPMVVPRQSLVDLTRDRPQGRKLSEIQPPSAQDLERAIERAMPSSWTACCRKSPARNGSPRAGHPQAARPVRKDRNHQRLGCLVCRISAHDHGSHLDWLRHATQPGQRETGGASACPWISFMEKLSGAFW